MKRFNNTYPKQKNAFVPVFKATDGGREIESKIAVEKKFLRTPEVALIMGISEQTVRRWIKNEKISDLVKPVKIGRIILFEREKIKEFLEKGKPEIKVIENV